MKKYFILLFLAMVLLTRCDILQNIQVPSGPAPLTTAEIIDGLKDALSVGTNNAVGVLSQENGFYGNPLFRIPFPEEAKVVEEKLRAVGMNKLVDDFIVTLNRGAEKAVTKAGPIFLNAIKQMTFDDARSILNGPENAATEYFRTNTSAQLVAAFTPEVKTTLDQVQVTKYWTDITTAYNKIPLTRKVETDLAKYVTDLTVKALFTKLADEEKLIRTDPKARVTEILRRVFGS
jgi:hypothetical protein